MVAGKAVPPSPPTTQICVPRVSAKTSRSAVAAATAAGILVVAAGKSAIGVRATTACVARSSARHAAVSSRGATRIAGVQSAGTATGFDPKRSARDSFAFCSILTGLTAHGSGVRGGSGLAIICVGAASAR